MSPVIRYYQLTGEFCALAAPFVSRTGAKKWSSAEPKCFCERPQKHEITPMHAFTLSRQADGGEHGIDWRSRLSPNGAI